MGTENSEAGANGSQQKYVAAGCEHCSRRFKLRRWRDGIKCPKCGSGKLVPLLAEGGAVDYLLADRSNGYAQHDIRLAEWVKWAGLITPRQYEMAFKKQHSRIRQQSAPMPIHKIMVEEDWITEKQAIALLEFMCRKRPDRDDRHFAEAAVASGLAGKEEVDNAMAAQQKIAEKANETPPLCQVMLEKHIINETKTLALLKKLQHKEQGSLYSVIGEVRGTHRKMAKRKPLRNRLAGRSHLVKQSALIIALFLGATGIWFWQYYQPPQRFHAVCEVCREINTLEWSADFPHNCPSCGRQSAYEARICEECGHIFPTRTTFVPQSCPECGSADVRTLEKEDLPDK